ncbi:MAG TPA: 3D domain-containing protein [Blastocatellia bacterium]|nr:3D domain-containing protein [Blastocatellia bacterium]
MNHTPNRRFTNGLSSGLSILAIFAFGYSINGNAQTLRTADHPTVTKTAEEKSLDIPGTFKDLPAATDAVTSKRAVVEPRRSARPSANLAQLTIDESKGVSNRTPARSTTKPTARPVAPPAVRGGSADVIDATDAEFEDFHATAYCLQGRTASGELVQPGIIAADPRVLPIGTVVHIRAGKYTGTYTVKDTGERIKGRRVDVYVPSYREAKAFGRRPVKIKILSRAGRNMSRTSQKSVLADTQ